LIEPFIGGAAVYFHLQPERAILADINPELVNLYRVVRDLPEQLMAEIDTLAAHPGHQHDPGAVYYEIRNRQPVDLPTDRLDADGIPTADEDRLWVAARTLYLNKTGFNGLFRVNSKGYFNVPWGRRARLPKLYDRAEVINASRLLAGAEILLADFGVVLDRARPGDFVYLDPPYFPVSATASFTSYTRLDFPPAEQQRLADWLHILDQRGVAFLLNNSDTPFTRQIYADFQIDVAQAKRMINSDASKRGAVNELIVRNPVLK
jgi:DNA adenine methylase